MRRPITIAAVPLALIAFSVVTLASAAPAAATWSLAATDGDNGQVGVALASCVPAEILGSIDEPLVPLVVVPGNLAAVTQGQLNLSAPPRIRELAAAGAGVEDIISALSDPAWDPQWQTRQHALVDVNGEAAGFTGDGLSADSLDQQGPGVSVQGNLLTSDQVIVDSLAAFVDRRAAAGDLAHALVDGLLAGSRAGGDRRCEGQTALFAQLVVAQAGDEPDRPSLVLTVLVDQGDGQNPVELLAAAFDEEQVGLIDAGRGDGSGGRLTRFLALITGMLMAVAGAMVFRRGLGSANARR